IARFSKSASAAPAASAAATPPPAPATDTESPPAAEPAEKPAPEEKPTASAHVSSEGSSFVPRNLVPVYIGAGIAVAAGVVGVWMLASKASAQNNATATADAIKAHGGTQCPATTDTIPPGGDLAGFMAACSQFEDNNKQVNTDATIGNIAVGVAV